MCLHGALFSSYDVELDGADTTMSKSTNFELIREKEYLVE